MVQQLSSNFGGQAIKPTPGIGISHFFHVSLGLSVFLSLSDSVALFNPKSINTFMLLVRHRCQGSTRETLLFLSLSL